MEQLNLHAIFHDVYILTNRGIFKLVVRNNWLLIASPIQSRPCFHRFIFVAAGCKEISSRQWYYTINIRLIIFLNDQFFFY